MLTALDRQVELAVHIKGALNNGCTVDEIRETLLQTAVYCGVPAAIEAFRTAERCWTLSRPRRLAARPTAPRCADSAVAADGAAAANGLRPGPPPTARRWMHEPGRIRPGLRRPGCDGRADRRAAAGAPWPAGGASTPAPRPCAAGRGGRGGLRLARGGGRRGRDGVPQPSRPGGDARGRRRPRRTAARAARSGTWSTCPLPAPRSRLSSAASLDAAKVGYLDAPVSGGPAGAAEGRLTVMAAAGRRCSPRSARCSTRSPARSSWSATSRARASWSRF